MGVLTVRISDELHATVRRLAGPRRLNRWVVEAIAEKAGRARVEQELADIRRRLDALERRIGL